MVITAGRTERATGTKNSGAAAATSGGWPKLPSHGIKASRLSTVGTPTMRPSQIPWRTAVAAASGCQAPRACDTRMETATINPMPQTRGTHKMILAKLEAASSRGPSRASMMVSAKPISIWPS